MAHARPHDPVRRGPAGRPPPALARRAARGPCSERSSDRDADSRRCRARSSSQCSTSMWKDPSTSRMTMLPSGSRQWQSVKRHRPAVSRRGSVVSGGARRPTRHILRTSISASDCAPPAMSPIARRNSSSPSAAAHGLHPPQQVLGGGEAAAGRRRRARPGLSELSAGRPRTARSPARSRRGESRERAIASGSDCAGCARSARPAARRRRTPAPSATRIVTSSRCQFLRPASSAALSPPTSDAGSRMQDSGPHRLLAGQRARGRCDDHRSELDPASGRDLVAHSPAVHAELVELAARDEASLSPPPRAPRSPPCEMLPVIGRCRWSSSTGPGSCTSECGGAHAQVHDPATLAR